MRKVSSTVLITTAILLVLPAMAAAATSLVQDSYHLDQRSTPKIQFEPKFDAPAGLTAEGLARHFLETRATVYGLPDDLGNLKLVRVRESMLGKHYVFQQQLHGIDVDKAEILVSVARNDGRVYRVFNNTYPVKNNPAAPSAVMSEDEAFEAGWQQLRAHGDLMAAPRSRLVYMPEGEGFRLEYVIELDLTGPYGGWRQRIDAVTGEILTLEDNRLMRLKTEETEIPPQERIDAYSGPVWDRQEVFNRYARQQAEQADRLTKVTPADGSGVVFDPDPRATLMDDNLQDTSPPSAFIDAYFTRNLLDINYNGSIYQLNGPWITIVNWDPPNTPPSTTADGNWTATRGDNAFNDAMTYFQIDQNQRYMQSLGFTGATGIQDGPITTDTDGVNGADNSYYQAGANRMSFGHGCVDDSEDTDVMLHEYGHAINHDINPSWGGGDMGAIGEGFGDYWAGSYSYSTPNGIIYHPEWVFSWDGHGTGNQCWPGRILNAYGAMYVHTTFYGAHQTIPGGFQSDELWSTPNFSSLTQLIALGYSRDEVDQIILEAQFGLGGGLKMRDMANAIIATAGALHPGEPHASVFQENFLRHGIVEIPQAVLEIAALTVIDGGNGAPDPGETVQLVVRLVNSGTLDAQDIGSLLSTSSGLVSVTTASSAYPDLPMGAEGDNMTNFVFSVDPSYVCGDPIDFQLAVDFSQGGGNPDMTTLNFSLVTGVPIGVAQALSPELQIPDNNPNGVRSYMLITGSDAYVSENFNVDINIQHTWIGDLRVSLESPGGTVVLLHNRTGSSADDIIGNYPNTLTPAQPLSAFLDEPLDGTWILTVSDHAGQDVGILHSWGINDVSGYDCDEVATAVGDDLQPARFAVHQNQPNPFNPATVIRFEVPRDGTWISLDIFDITGSKVRTLRQGSFPAGMHEATWRGRDDAGRPVSSGIYFYRLQGSDFSETRKMVLLQ